MENSLLIEKNNSNVEKTDDNHLLEFISCLCSLERKKFELSIINKAINFN